jgi:hypothetical protein
MVAIAHLRSLLTLIDEPFGTQYKHFLKRSALHLQPVQLCMQCLSVPELSQSFGIY